MSDKENKDVKIPQINGEQDHEFPHIVRLNGKLYCNECGDWDWLKYWQDFINKHRHDLD